MSHTSMPMAVLAGSTLLGLGLAMAAPDQSKAGEGSGLRCEIYQSQRWGSVVLEGVVYANGAVSGSYQFQVNKAGGGGSSNINQGGEFSVGAGGKSTVGSVSLAGDGGYSATLRVTADGHSASCKDRTGGSL